MNHMFPFRFDSHLSFYLVIYVLTWVVHFFLMAYVLAGSLWLVWTTLFPGTGTVPRTKQPLARLLRDWMPFALSGAITAGVAPLLFVQILYRQQFYTSNLLLGWRWMVVIPVLVAAFYLLYVVKSETASRWPLIARLGLSIGIAACFLFVAFCWTANHLLSLSSAVWPEAYRSGEAVRSTFALSMRLLTWVAGTFPTMSILASWQLRGMRSRTAAWDASISEAEWAVLFNTEHRRLGYASIAGIAAAFACACGYWTTLETSVHTQLIGHAGWPWLIIAIASSLFQIVGWVMQFRRPCLCNRWLTTITVALLTALVAVASLREIVRLSLANLDQATTSTRAASQVGGFRLFLVFTVLNIGLIAWCIHMVRSRKPRIPQ
ncbi:MAG: hypothetical protein DWH81_05520 [Planctomycetota bacterium]|nr:MAG: hypothetical protein DWH81_05520 [Planctomycetota bacterium]